MSSFCAIHGARGRIMERNVENKYKYSFYIRNYLKGEAIIWIGDLYYPYYLPLL